MEVSMNDVLYELSFALDSVEHEILGASTYHSKRIAFLSVCVGRLMGLDDSQLADMACCAVLHDNALTEYAATEYQSGRDVVAIARQRAATHSPDDVTADGAPIELSAHCTYGERNISQMPFYPRVPDVILYHHENADGSGPFGVPAEATPLYARIIHLTDIVDVTYDLSTMDSQKYDDVIASVKRLRGIAYCPDVADAFLQIASRELLSMITGEDVRRMLYSALPDVTRDYSDDEIVGLATIFARITDYKSLFTRKHSEGIARKARDMAAYYGWGKGMETRLYLTGALHDIGKLVIDNDILEKPGKLDAAEFAQMKNHAWFTYQILHRIRGFEDITRWASFHHEKLDGSGYPFGKMGYELNMVERLLGCIDIYQALIEERPYKLGFSHADAIGIMREMASAGKIDGGIVEDIDKRFSGSSAVSA